MRFLSQIFQPILTIPKNAKVKSTEVTCISQKLLLECGLIRPTSAGLFTLLPLARRALDKLENLVRQSIESAGGQRISLPSLTPVSFWERSGRLELCRSELMMLSDRHSKKYVLAPTQEEAIADLLSDVSPLSYKQLPLLLYQISDKFRDEQRPKHGLLRSRQFVMMDAYGAHTDLTSAGRLYDSLSEQYAKLFERLRLDVYRVEAPSGEMGGSVSHEWHVKAEAGEDVIHYCQRCQLTGIGQTCVKCQKEINTSNSIEVGHTFILGTKYSEALGANYTTNEGLSKPILMSCYGIGLTRLLAASIESLADEKIRWPTILAPFSIIIIGPKEGSKEWSSGGWEKVLELSNELSKLSNLTDDILIDDRHNLTIGKRLLQADKMGYPITIVCGSGALDSPQVFEVKTTDSNTKLTLEQLATFVKEYLK